MSARPDSLATRLAWTAYAVARAPLQRRAPFRSPAALERAQRRRVRAAVRHAWEHVPHYRETMDRLGLTPADFASARDLAKLPIVERAELQADPERFVSRARPAEHYVQLATDGTSGVSVRVLHDPFALFQGATHGERREAIVFALSGRRFRLRRVSIAETTGSVARSTSAFRRRSLVPANVRYDDTWLSMKDPVEVNARRLAELRPDMVRSYGSYLEALFAHVAREAPGLPMPPVAVYGADGISEPVRRIMLDELGVAPISEYGAGEAHHIGLECERHTGLHLNEDLYPLRIVEPGGHAELPAGEPGDVVLSNLVNRATVLLNYRLGDRAARIPGRCPCGRTLPRLTLPEGRLDDWVQAPSGERVHPQELRGLVLADDRWVLAFQIEQQAAARFAVSVVVRDDTDVDALRGRIAERFTARFGPETETSVAVVGALRRTPGGKVRVVTSRSAHAPAPAAP